jgi:glutathione S-transferase
MLRIYGRGRTRSIKCLWAAEEAGLAYEYISIDMSKGEHKSPDFNKLNPSQKVPVLVDGELTLSESAAICTYIGSRSKNSSLVPPDLTPERALSSSV